MTRARWRGEAVLALLAIVIVAAATIYALGWTVSCRGRNLASPCVQSNPNVDAGICLADRIVRTIRSRDRTHPVRGKG
ncbi:MAG TPA: hypothetical protein VFT39_15905 [Vicinamibacterales bacterium]|nr:hypothetical protein [Vicinamibacterales bacterium]